MVRVETRHSLHVLGLAAWILPADNARAGRSIGRIVSRSRFTAPTLMHESRNGACPTASYSIYAGGRDHSRYLLFRRPVCPCPSEAPCGALACLSEHTVCTSTGLPELGPEAVCVKTCILPRHVRPLHAVSCEEQGLSKVVFASDKGQGFVRSGGVSAEGGGFVLDGVSIEEIESEVA